MAERTSHIGDGVFYVLMSFVLAAAFGAGIGFAYGGLLDHGWSGGFMVGALVAAVVGLVLSLMLGRKLPPPNTVTAPVARAGGLHTAPAGGAHQAPASAAAPSAPSRTERASGPDVSAALDRVSATAGGAAAAVSEKLGAVADRISEKLGGAGDSAGRTMDDLSDAAKGAGEAASEKVREARESVAAAVAPETAPADAPNARVRDAAREAGEAARGMDSPASEPVRLMDAGGEAEVEAVRPPGLDSPREDRGDDLKKIKGVGPKLEALLQSLGFWHFDQIASWSDAELAWVDSNLEGFNGRASRDEWIAQAKVLAAGGETEFSERVDKGEVYD